MNRATISYTRNHLSGMISRVKKGESILILDRQRPVARLEPISGGSAEGLPWQAHLIRSGQIRPPRGRLDPKALGAMALPAARGRGDILAALLAERDEER